METTYDRRSLRRQKAGGYKPSDEEAAALDYIHRRFKPEDPVKLALEQQWLTNIAFLRGYQYMSWDPVQRSLVFSQAPSLRWKSRLPYNLCRPYVRQAVSQVGAFHPKFKGRPATNDPEDYQRAATAETVADHFWTYCRMPTKKWEVLHWMKTCGNAFVKVLWNPRGGDPVWDDEPTIDGETGFAELLYEGDIESEVVSPFSIYVDSFAESPEDIHWLIQVTARPIEWVEKNFPDKAALVPPGIQGESYHSRRRWMVGATAPTGASVAPGDENEKNWVLVKEMWEKPSLDFPRGQLLIEANGVLLRSGDNPCPKGRIPYIWLRDDIVPGMVWGQCDLDNILPLQRTYNRLINKQIEHVVLTANAKALQHSSNELSDSQWATEVEVMTWHGVTPPQWLPPPPMGADTESLANQVLQNFDRVSSSYGPARGQYQGKISGKAYIALIEQDIQTKSPLIERLSDGFSDWASLVLLWVKDYVTEPRLIAIVGRDKQFDVSEFQGADLGDNTDVRIDVESMMPKSKAMALELIQILSPGAKWLNEMNPEDRTRVWRMLGMEDDSRLFSDKTRHERWAKIENKLMMLGKVIEPPKPYEDIDVHMLVHDELRNSDEYKSAPPIIRAIVDAHCDMHLKMAMPQVGVTVPMMPPLPGGDETVVEGDEPKPKRGGGGGGGGGEQNRQPQGQPMQAFA